MSDRPDLDKASSIFQNGSWGIPGGKYAPKPNPIKRGSKDLLNNYSTDTHEAIIADPILQEIEKIFLGLIDEISSIKAGKTFTPTDYTKLPVKAIANLVIDGKYDTNRLGSWVFIGDIDKLNNLDDLYWSYVQEFVANDNPHREESYEKMDYIKKTMPYASFSSVGIFKLLARADQRAKERIATLEKLKGR